MFDKGKFKYGSDIEVGKRYIDEQTGIRGTATSISFFQHACERVCIETVVNNKIEEYHFDAPRLTCEETKRVARAKRTGGPRSASSPRKGAERAASPGR